MAVQQKIVFVVSGLSPLELLHTSADFLCVVGFVVDNLFCGGCLAYPLIVAVDIGRYLQTAVAVSPNHPLKWLLLMAVIHVDAGGEN